MIRFPSLVIVDYFFLTLISSNSNVQPILWFSFMIHYLSI